LLSRTAAAAAAVVSHCLTSLYF